MSIEHTRYYQESGCDGALADPEQEATNEEACEIVTGSVSAEDDAPNEDVARHPFAWRKLLQAQRLWPLEDEIGEVEDCSEPVILRLG